MSDPETPATVVRSSTSPVPGTGTFHGHLVKRPDEHLTHLFGHPHRPSWSFVDWISSCHQTV
jgi:hypothetical protein